MVEEDQVNEEELKDGMIDDVEELDAEDLDVSPIIPGLEEETTEPATKEPDDYEEIVNYFEEVGLFEE